MQSTWGNGARHSTRNGYLIAGAGRWRVGISTEHGEKTMKKFIVRSKYGVVWQGETLSRDFALIRAAKALGYNTLEECRQAGIGLKVEDQPADKIQS